MKQETLNVFKRETLFYIFSITFFSFPLLLFILVSSAIDFSYDPVWGASDDRQLSLEQKIDF